ncbi:MAG: hypothetical protein QOG25_1529, partial [Acetobacteraceae bacterium]|nr:hypothetical protein [Acetobacteraceae bacterium]
MTRDIPLPNSELTATGKPDTQPLDREFGDPTPAASKERPAPDSRYPRDVDFSETVAIVATAADPLSLGLSETVQIMVTVPEHVALDHLVDLVLPETVSETPLVPAAADSDHPPGVDFPEKASALEASSPVGHGGPGKPVILIEIDPSVAVGFVHNRSDMMIRGRAISAAPIQEIRLQAGGFVASTASYGQPERAAASVMPDGSPARQRAFRFNLPRPRETEPGVEPGAEPEQCAFQIIARTEDGFEYAEDFAIALDATAPTPVSIISGPTRPALASGARPHVVMYIERGTIDSDGILSVQGWAVSLGSISTVQIFAGETRTSNARMDRERTDVAKAFPAYPSARLSGFNLTVQLDPADLGAETIRARIECPNGFAHEQAIPVERVQRRGTPPRPPADQRKFADDPSLDLVPSLHVAGVLPSGQRAELAADQPEARPSEVPPEIRMFCDAATLTGDGTLSVKGWAVCRAGIAQVRVMLNA